MITTRFLKCKLSTQIFLNIEIILGNYLEKVLFLFIFTYFPNLYVMEYFNVGIEPKSK